MADDMHDPREHEVRFREIRREDRARVLALLGRNLEYDCMTEPLIEEQLWEDPAFEPKLNQVAETNGSIVGFGAAVMRRKTEGFIKGLVVDEPYRGKGLGATLLCGLEAGLHARGARSVRLGESAPIYWWPGLDVRYTRAMVFFEAHGYTKVGETFNMEVDLIRLKPPIEKKGLIEFHRARPEDREQVIELVDAYWSGWRPETERCFANEPISLHLARADGKLAGFSAYDSGHPGTGWFGPMGTVPAQRGRGIGRTLLKRCLYDLKEQGLQKAVIPWVGPVAFYVRHARARISRVFYRYKKNL